MVLDGSGEMGNNGGGALLGIWAVLVSMQVLGGQRVAWWGEGELLSTGCESIIEAGG